MNAPKDFELLAEKAALWCNTRETFDECVRAMASACRASSEQFREDKFKAYADMWWEKKMRRKVHNG